MLKGRHTMRLMFLSLFFQYDLLHFIESEEANINGFLQTGDELKARTLDHYMNYTIIEVFLTPRIYQMNQINTQYSVPTIPVDNETNTLKNSSSKQTHDAGLRSTPSKYPNTYIHNTTHTTSSAVPKPEETSSSLTDVVSPYINIYPSGFQPDSVTLNTETTVDPLVAENAKKWLEEIERVSTTVTTKLLIPNSAETFPQPNRRNEKTTQRKISNGKLNNNAFRPQTRPIVRQGDTVPQIYKRRHSETEAETFRHDPATQSEESAVYGTRRSQSPVTKQRLRPGLLLGKATIGGDVTSGSDESKKIMRMHEMSATTMKQWYSDRTVVQKELMGITKPTSRIEFLRHTTFPSSRTAKSTTQSYNKMKKIRQDSYMIVFLIELSRLIATKEKRAVHDVIKHTYQIIHGFFKNGKFQWFPQTLIYFTKKAAKLLKESETGDVQKQAANLHHILRHRSQMLSHEVNGIIEYADRLYDKDEGEHLLEALNEFAKYPNTALSGYWLCNRLINNFLRPYRRLADSRPRQQLMDSINMALKTRFTSGGANETNDKTELSTHKEPPSETTRTPRGRKKKRRHRLRKRKRERKRYRMHRPLPDKAMMLRSMASRTSMKPSVLVTT